MTSRNEVRIDIEVEGGARAERQFDRAEKGARGLGRSTRGLINPLLGAGLVSGILGGGLLSLALSSGSASNSIFRIQGALEGLTGTILRSLEPAIDFAATQFEKLPIAAQLGVLGLGIIMGGLLIAAFKAGIGALAGAIGGLLAPIGTAITTGFTTLLAGVGVAVAIGVAAIVVGLASLALIAWDLIFNDGEYLTRFDAWLSEFTFFQWAADRDAELTTFFTTTFPAIFTTAWDKVVEDVIPFFTDPIKEKFNAVKTFFTEDVKTFFTEDVPGFFLDAWNFVIDDIVPFFTDPMKTAFGVVKTFFTEDVKTFFTEDVPKFFKEGWDAADAFFVGFANTLIGGMNTLIQSIGKLPIPTVSVGVAYKSVGGISIPYPTFSVSTRPLSSLIDLPTIPTIPVNAGDAATRRFDETGDAVGSDRNQGGATNNYYSLSATDFARRVQEIINSPNAQARAVGAT